MSNPLCFVLPPLLSDLLEFFGGALWTVLLHCDVCVQVVEGTIHLRASRKVTTIARFKIVTLMRPLNGVVGRFILGVSYEMFQWASLCVIR